MRAEIDLPVHVPIQRRMPAARPARRSKDQWRREVDWVEAIFFEFSASIWHFYQSNSIITCYRSSNLI